MLSDTETLSYDDEDIDPTGSSFFLVSSIENFCLQMNKSTNSIGVIYSTKV